MKRVYKGFSENVSDVSVIARSEADFLEKIDSEVFQDNSYLASYLL